ncbi:MAG TPA: hypothetical protein VGO11_03365 [Chthoniobacteraceae bacterium]|nr:hypothetical protein [Chthoniobacteraceae bacterium]
MFMIGVTGFAGVGMLMEGRQLVIPGCLLVLVAPILMLWQRNAVYSFEATNQGVIMTVNGKAHKAVRIWRPATVELALEHYSGGDCVEAVATLSLWVEQGGHRRRHLIGITLTDSARQSIYRDLLTFLRQQGIEVTARNQFEKELPP